MISHREISTLRAEVCMLKNIIAKIPRMEVGRSSFYHQAFSDHTANAKPGPDGVFLSMTDPLFTMSTCEVAGAMRMYREEVGIYYPPVDIDSLLAQLSESLASSYALRQSGADGVITPWTDEYDVAMVKVMLACGLEVGNARSASLNLYASLKDTLESAMTDAAPSIKNVVLLAVAVGC